MYNDISHFFRLMACCRFFWNRCHFPSLIQLWPFHFWSQSLARFPSGQMKDVVKIIRHQWNPKLPQGWPLNHPHESPPTEPQWFISQSNKKRWARERWSGSGVESVNVSNHGEVAEFNRLSTASSSSGDQQVRTIRGHCVRHRNTGMKGAINEFLPPTGATVYSAQGRAEVMHSTMALLGLGAQYWCHTTHLHIIPCYWLVWSQPAVLGSNNKQSSFFSSPPLTLSPPIALSLPHTLRETDGKLHFLPPTPRWISYTHRSWFIDQSHVNTAVILHCTIAQNEQRLLMPPGWIGSAAKAVIRRTQLVLFKRQLLSLCISVHLQNKRLKPLNRNLVMFMNDSVCIDSACVRRHDELLQRRSSAQKKEEKKQQNFWRCCHIILTANKLLTEEPQLPGALQ